MHSDNTGIVLNEIFDSDCLFDLPALDEAAERFRQLQAEKELRQLQEDRRNDKKPPPYKHIKVSNHTEVFFLLLAITYQAESLQTSS